MEKIIAWFTQNNVAANLLMVFLLVGGLIYGLNSKVEIFPNVNLDKISISVEYPGASPEEVEEGIIYPIEEAISGLAGIKNIDSIALEGWGSVVVEVVKGWDTSTLYDEIKSEVDRLTNLPDTAKRPVVKRLTRKSQVLSIAVYGNLPEHVLKHYAQKIKDGLTSQKGVSLATLAGTRENQIKIEVSPQVLRKYGLSLDQIAQKIAAFSQDLPLGRIKSASGELKLRIKDKSYTAKDFASIPILTRPDGSKITLGELATLKDGFEDKDQEVLFQGLPAVLINVFRIGEQNALKVAQITQKYISQVKSTLPPNLYVQIYNDSSQLLKGRLELLLKNMAFGLILVALILSLFLDLKLAFWVTLGIPVSFAGAMLFLPSFDVSINMISLFAFIMVLGIVVDDAIVIGENVYTQRQKGLDPLQACVQGTSLMAVPVIFSVLTTIAAFFPLLLGSGTMGKFMRNIPLVVNLVLVFSLIESLLILPCHLYSSLKRSVSQKQTFASKILNQFVRGPYSWLLKRCLQYRYVTLACAVSLILISVGLVKGGIIKFTFFPKVESTFITCSLTMPAGTNFVQTKKIIKHIERSLRQVIQVEDQKRKDKPSLLKYTASLVGMQMTPRETRMLVVAQGGNVGQVMAELLDSEYRKVSASYLVQKWRKAVGKIPGVEELTFSSDLFSFGKPIAIDLSHPNYQTLIRASKTLQQKLSQIKGVVDVSDSFTPGKKEIVFKLTPLGQSLGFTGSGLARIIRNGFYGKTALSLQRDKDEVKVKVMYPENLKNSLFFLQHLWITAPNGQFVPLTQIATFQLEQGSLQIVRHNKKRILTVYADVAPGKANADEVRTFLQDQILPQLQKQFPGLEWSFAGTGKEKQESMRDIFQGFALALLLIYILLAVPLKSYLQPLIIMLSIPFSIIGAILGHLLLGFNLCILSLFGIVGLAGVAVNDALVLLDAANKFMLQGEKPLEAALKAGQSRFRAVILTSLTTFFGLVPIISEKSLQAQFLIPMAISLGFGVLLATFITLLLIPCAYVIRFDLKRD